MFKIIQISLTIHRTLTRTRGDVVGEVGDIMIMDANRIVETSSLSLIIHSGGERHDVVYW